MGEAVIDSGTRTFMKQLVLLIEFNRGYALRWISILWFAEQ